MILFTHDLSSFFPPPRPFHPGKEGLSFEETSERFGVGVASLKRWSKRLHPKPYERRKIRKIDLEKLAQDVRDHPNAYQYERAARFGVCQKSIWQALRKLSVTHKKPCATQRQTPPNGVPAAKRLWRMKPLDAPLFTLMKAVLRRTCRAPTVMRRVEPVVLDCKTGMRVGG